LKKGNFWKVSAAVKGYCKGNLQGGGIRENSVSKTGVVPFIRWQHFSRFGLSREGHDLGHQGRWTGWGRGVHEVGLEGLCPTDTTPSTNSIQTEQKSLTSIPSNCKF